MMPLPVRLQLYQAGLSLLLGAGLGLWYDLLRAVRVQHKAPALTYVLDVLFWLPAALSLFSLGMGAGAGQLRLFMLLAAGLGALLYLHWLSPGILPGLCKFCAGIAKTVALPGKVLSRTKNSWKKSRRSEKKVFPNAKKWATMKGSEIKTEDPKDPGGEQP